MSHSDPSQLNMPEFSVEIFSDVICPWCFIGKRRLDQTLTRLNAELAAAVRLRWRPYQLYPNLPPEGVNRAELLRQRYGDQADSARVPERIRAEAEEEAPARLPPLQSQEPQLLGLQILLLRVSRPTQSFW